MAVEDLELKPGERTPAGGVKAIAVYLDDQGRDAPKEIAVRVIIRELDAAGKILRETFAVITSNDERPRDKAFKGRHP